uniref:Uncharacterized protein n=11 Tax=Avena sativa TaxID=4498 RepID=A0ACD5X2V2_AVESA
MHLSCSQGYFICNKLMDQQAITQTSAELKDLPEIGYGHEWRRCYQIMNGICDVLYYLHIIHLDWKPTNILLDYYVKPKIAYFRLSWCFSEKQSLAITSNLIRTMGYLAPEFYTSGKITFKSDI